MKPRGYYQCVICGRSFERRGKLKAHVVFGHNFRAPLRKVYCCFCNKPLKHMVRLMVHTVHECEHRPTCSRYLVSIFSSYFRSLCAKLLCNIYAKLMFLRALSIQEFQQLVCCSAQWLIYCLWYLWDNHVTRVYSAFKMAAWREEDPGTGWQNTPGVFCQAVPGSTPRPAAILKAE